MSNSQNTNRLSTSLKYGALAICVLTNTACGPGFQVKSKASRMATHSTTGSSTGTNAGTGAGGGTGSGNISGGGGPLGGGTDAPPPTTAPATQPSSQPATQPSTAPAVTDSSRATISVEGKQLSFFPEVAMVLNDLSSGFPGESLATGSTNCPAHIELIQSYPVLAPRDSFECAGAKEAYKELFKHTSVCHEVQDPIAFFSGLPAQPVDYLSMADLGEIAKLYAPAIAAMAPLGGFKRQVYIEKLKSVLVKVRGATTHQRLANNRTHMLKINSDLLRGGQCLRGFPAEISRSIDLISRAYNENLALDAQLAQIEASGVAQAQADLARVQATGRSRANLPYPAMTDDDRRFLSGALSSILWRSRGGGVFHEPTNTNERRVMFTLVPMREIARLNGGDRAAGSGTDLWMGLFEPWGHFHDMGRVDGDKWSDYASMQERGQAQVSTMVSTVAGLGYDAKAVSDAGLMMADCYWFGWERLSQAQMGMHLQGVGPYQHVAGVATQWGELCTGASMGFGISESLLKGYR